MKWILIAASLFLSNTSVYEQEMFHVRVVNQDMRYSQLEREKIKSQVRIRILGNNGVVYVWSHMKVRRENEELGFQYISWDGRREEKVIFENGEILAFANGQLTYQSKEVDTVGVLNFLIDREKGVRKHVFIRTFD